MKFRNDRKVLPAAALAATLALAAFATPRRAAAQVFAQPEGDRWAVAAALAPWFPTINGDLEESIPEAGGPEGTINVKMGPNDYLTHLKFALPFVVDVRNEKWSVLTDFTYVNLTQDSNVNALRPPGAIPITVTGNLKTETTLKGLLWNETFGWTVAGKPSGSFLDLMVGVRYCGLKAETDWHLEAAIEEGGQVILSRDGKRSENTNLWDGIFGVRGKARLGDKWSLPYLADIGTGTSKVTWQGSVGVAFAPGKMEFAICYRHVSWEQKDDKLVQSLRMGGPQFAIGYRF